MTSQMAPCETLPRNYFIHWFNRSSLPVDPHTVFQGTGRQTDRQMDECRLRSFLDRSFQIALEYLISGDKAWASHFWAGRMGAADSLYPTGEKPVPLCTDAHPLLPQYACFLPTGLLSDRSRLRCHWRKYMAGYNSRSRQNSVHTYSTNSTEFRNKSEVTIHYLVYYSKCPQMWHTVGLMVRYKNTLLK